MLGAGTWQGGRIGGLPVVECATRVENDRMRPSLSSADFAGCEPGSWIAQVKDIACVSVGEARIVAVLSTGPVERLLVQRLGGGSLGWHGPPGPFCVT